MVVALPVSIPFAVVNLGEHDVANALAARALGLPAVGSASHERLLHEPAAPARCSVQDWLLSRLHHPRRSVATSYGVHDAETELPLAMPSPRVAEERRPRRQRDHGPIHP